MDFDDEYSEGFQIEGEGLDGSQPSDAASDWLMANDPDQEDAELVSPNGLMGMATAADIQLARFQNTEPRIQAGVIAAINGTLQGVDEIDRAAAVEQFGAEIGGDPVAFAKRLKVDASVNPPRHHQDLKTVLSMLGKTSGEYMDKGPGSNLATHTLNSEKQEKWDADLQTALGYVSELADLYIDGRTRGSTIEPVKRRAIEESLTNRLMNGVFYEGAKSTLPLPNELFHNGTDGTRVTGTIVTQGVIPSIFGTAQNRLSGSNIKGTDKDALRQIPNLANSLYPQPYLKGAGYTQEQRDKHKRDQEFAMSQAQYKADFARRVFLEQMPTHRDESAQQKRTAGFDRPYDEQERIQSLRDEAVRRGLDWYAGDDTSTLPQELVSLHGKGSDRTGMYGQKLKSEVDEFVEQANEATHSRSTTASGDRAAYLAYLEKNPQPEQGTPEWLALRKGNITASAVVGGFGKPALLEEGGVEARALELARSAAGLEEPFVGNSHTKDGNDGEHSVLASFLAGPGKDLDFEKAYFESGDKNGLPGWGVSPDGRLYNKLTGASEGLLELKYLSDVKGARKKYNDQMQTQMMVTGESKTSFYALNKYTGEYDYHVVHADPDRQAQLRQAGDMAISMSAGLDARGIQALRNKMNAKLEARKPANAQGQTKAFEPEEPEAEEKMTAFRQNTSGSANRAEETVFAEQMKRMEAKEQVDKAKEILTGMAHGVASSPQEAQANMRAKANFVHNSNRPDAFGSEPDSEMSKHYKREEEEASRKATESMRRFSDATSAAVTALGELGGAVMSGNKSGLDEVRLAAETGMDVKNIRGMRKALEKGDLSEAGINSVINNAGILTKTFNDEAKAADRFTTIMADRGKSNLGAVRSLDLPSLQEMRDMNPQQWTAMVASKMEGQSPEVRAQIGQMFGMEALAANDVSSDVIGSAVDGVIDEGGLRASNDGITDITQTTRDMGEKVGSLGYAVGLAGAGAVVASKFMGGILGGRAGGFMGRGGSAFMRAAGSASPKVASMAKNLSNAAKITPVAAAFAIAPMAVRGLADIKDDGGVGDSAMDILEFAGYGAAAGSFLPGVGTLIGAGVGAAVGVANEAWEWATEDALPDGSIGKVASISQDSPSKQMNNNVDVNVEINGNEYRVTTNVNGDELLDEGTGITT